MEDCEYPDNCDLANCEFFAGDVVFKGRILGIFCRKSNLGMSTNPTEEDKTDIALRSDCFGPLKVISLKKAKVEEILEFFQSSNLCHQHSLVIGFTLSLLLKKLLNNPDTGIGTILSEISSSPPPSPSPPYVA